MLLNFKLLISKLFVTTSIVLFFANYSVADETDISRGKYLVEIGGCNDCHTAGFGPSGGTTPESERLLGSNLGFRGGWGTTYPSNLRVYFGDISEDEWIIKAKTLKTRPPMPWWVLNTMTEEDLRVMYKYIKSLGVVKSLVPSYVPPGLEPKTPFIQWPLPPN